MKIKYDYDNWDNWDWKSNNRYYKLSLSQNLFAEWVIIKQWGGLRTRVQGTKTIYCESIEEIKKIFKNTNKRRLARGYNLVA